MREDIILDSLDPREEYIKPELVEQTVNIHVEREQDQIIKIGPLISQEQKKELESFMKKNSDVLPGHW